MADLETPSEQQLERLRGRVAPRRRSEVPKDIAQALKNGWIESKNLVEWLMVDRIHLLNRLSRECGWTLDSSDRKWMKSLQSLSSLKQSQEIGRWLPRHVTVGDDHYLYMVRHPSDVVREWSALLVGSAPGLSFAKRLAWIKTQADDHNAGTRELAWLSIRPYIVEDPVESVRRLVPWTGSRNERLRRFASEATRPCGVWCAHVPLLKLEPEIGLPVLEPLRSDDSKYVANSVANWLNDASKSQPAWVRKITELWLNASPTAETRRIVHRALRTLGR